jgi:hypothetical protein
MCHVCKDEQCHYGEYCYPEGVSRRPQQEAAARAVDDEVGRQIMATSDADALAMKWTPLVRSAVRDDDDFYRWQ